MLPRVASCLKHEPIAMPCGFVQIGLVEKGNYQLITSLVVSPGCMMMYKLAQQL